MGMYNASICAVYVMLFLQKKTPLTPGDAFVPFSHMEATHTRAL
jgi:hypothetical protein